MCVAQLLVRTQGFVSSDAPAHCGWAVCAMWLCAMAGCGAPPRAHLLVISMAALSLCTSHSGWNSSTTSPSCSHTRIRQQKHRTAPGGTLSHSSGVSQCIEAACILHHRLAQDVLLQHDPRAPMDCLNDQTCAPHQRPSVVLCGVWP